jgi:hypothetical protein
VTLGFGAALAHLLHAAGPEQRGEAIPSGTPAPPAELLEQARILDMQHRHANRGKPISRERLKATLGIATNTASTLTHIIRTEQDSASTTEQDGQPAESPSHAS